MTNGRWVLKKIKKKVYQARPDMTSINIKGGLNKYIYKSLPALYKQLRLVEKIPNGGVGNNG